MNKTFTVSATSGTAKVEAFTKEEAMLRSGLSSIYSVSGPRFTTSYRSKPKSGKVAKRNTPKEAAQEVHYFGNRAAVRALARL